jgi:hypothetical protein
VRDEGVAVGIYLAPKRAVTLAFPREPAALPRSRALAIAARVSQAAEKLR